MSDDTTPRPPAGGIPPRRKKKKRRVQRDWLAPSQARPPAAAVSDPRIARRLAILVVGLGLLLGYAVVRMRNQTPTLPVFTNDAVPTALTADGVTDAPTAEAEEAHALAERLFGRELWLVQDKAEIAEEPEWQRVIAVMAEQDPQFVRDHLQFSLNLHYEEVMANPSAYRGQFVRMRGLVATNFMAQKLDHPVAGRGDVYRGLIADTDGDHPVFFDVLDPPPQFQKMYEAVDVDGVLYRTVTYETRGSEDIPSRVVEVPWIIARTVVPLQREKKEAPFGAEIGPIVAFLALVFAIVYLVRGGRRRKAVATVGPAGFRELFDRRLREERMKEPPPPADAGGEPRDPTR